MLAVPQPAGLPVVATRTVLLDPHHKFYRQQTARGDYVFVHESMGDLVEIAVMPIDAPMPIMRYSQVTPVLQPLIEKEYPGWQVGDPKTRAEFRKLDEENWPKEMSELFRKLLSWLTINGPRIQTYEQGVAAWQAEVVPLSEAELAQQAVMQAAEQEARMKGEKADWVAKNGPRPAPPKRPVNAKGVPHTVPEQEHADA
jgi:hypothetical protein